MKDNKYSYIEKDNTYKKNGQFFTPHDITDFILSIHGNPYFKKVYDPTSGYASTLFRVNQYNSNANFYGVEIDKNIYKESVKRTKDFKNFNLKNGDTLEDHFKEEKFDLIIANPPFGVKYDKSKYPDYKFYPKKNDSFILFMQHVINKLSENGKAYIVSSGSPLFSGDAGSYESGFRKHLFENNLVESIYQLPTGLFYDTDITTYIWCISKNNKKEEVDLINCSKCFDKMKSNLNKKSKELSFEKIELSEKVSKNKDYFFYNKVKIKFTEKNEDGKYETDHEIIEYSSNPIQNEELTQAFLGKWVERDYVMLDNKVGVEINFNKIFYKPEVLRPIDDIKSDLEESNAVLVGLMGDIFND